MSYKSFFSGRLCLCLQYVGFSSIEESNKFSDNPLAVADVGMAGVAVDSVEDMKVCVHVCICV